jgi:potassium/chloride transporter 9
LSMCSVAVFMRIGFIVGNAGVYESFALYALAFAIFFLTGLSVCAISTNGAIQGGGVYCKFISYLFLIRRTNLIK